MFIQELLRLSEVELKNPCTHKFYDRTQSFRRHNFIKSKN
jgi:hypothetical protein